MQITQLRKVGGSVMLALPPAILDLLDLRAGATVGLAVDGDRLVIETKPQPDEDREWIDAPAAGRELI